MLFYTILYYTILYLTKLHYTTLHYTILFYTILSLRKLLSSVLKSLSLFDIVFTEYASPPEKRQMVMVSGAYSHLCDKLKAGEVAGDVLLKLTQLIGDLTVRNFAGASAIQTVREEKRIFYSPRHFFIFLFLFHG